MVCRRLLGPLDRAVIMAGLEAGLSQGRTPRQISGRLREEACDTLPKSQPRLPHPNRSIQRTHCYHPLTPPDVPTSILQPVRTNYQIPCYCAKRLASKE